MTKRRTVTSSTTSFVVARALSSLRQGSGPARRSEAELAGSRGGPAPAASRSAPHPLPKLGEGETRDMLAHCLAKLAMRYRLVHGPAAFAFRFGAPRRS